MEGQRPGDAELVNHAEQGFVHLTLQTSRFFCFFVFFWGVTLQHTEFLGQGSDPSHSSYTAAAAMPDPLTHCAEWQIESGPAERPPIPLRHSGTSLLDIQITWGSYQTADADSREALRFCISTKSPGDAEAAGVVTTL